MARRELDVYFLGLIPRHFDICRATAATFGQSKNQSKTSCFARLVGHASLSYAQAEQVKFILRGDYYSYSTDEISEAWHRPTYKLTANASYNVYQKLLFKIDLIAQGGMKALEPVTLNTVKLDPAFDLNFRAEYLFSESFSIFIQLNNITGNKYPVFLNYPVRGFQAMGGITWSF